MGELQKTASIFAQSGFEITAFLLAPRIACLATCRTDLGIRIPVKLIWSSSGALTIIEKNQAVWGCKHCPRDFDTSKGVMKTVGRGIVKLDACSALIVVLSNAITVHIYAIIGVPVSTSQAVVGAVLGIGLLMRAEALKKRAILGAFSG